MRSFATKRWAGIEGLTLLVVAIGVLTTSSGLILAGIIGFGYAAYTKLWDAPVADVSIDRELGDEAPAPGETTGVTLTITNTGSKWLSDLRVIDGVPPALETIDGPARIGTSLRPGETTTCHYTVSVVRGKHTWDSLRLITRNPSGSRERETVCEVSTTLRCTPPLHAGANLSLHGLTTPYSGRVTTDVGGYGIEFHSTRAYRSGDPLNRIDWNRRARTGTLSTLNFREERAATVILLVDSRKEAYVAAEPTGRNAVERSVDAVATIFSSLISNGDRVGVATMSPTECWIAPQSGKTHTARVQEALATHPGLAPTATEGTLYHTLWFNRFIRRLPADAQVVFCSPFVDDRPIYTARRLHAYGHLVTVITPDETTADTIGDRIAAIERQHRLQTLRGNGIRVVDWGDEPLPTAVMAATQRWSQ